jgi:hypothetical protein
MRKLARRTEFDLNFEQPVVFGDPRAVLGNPIPIRPEIKGQKSKHRAVRCPIQRPPRGPENTNGATALMAQQH